ncbi:hypothetical protein NLM33_04775 [Bradyrhizobium sp. CCGUVB1N3]|uniref:hypothetical protein n=1 Tax=Bradyrhizobium sp. CCGUVB1N3 TaxID=2949629 RepID=UPI0020B41723|nr:hypothetical protein [Bradyrhizobium sp. CCGUVB1N3]MCP3469643.1 hypothetical protein [Bradyrhizobium sp. CCGUVB1N3]
MRKLSLIIAATAAISIAHMTASSAAELPIYEANGLPISPVQVGVLGAAQVQGQAQVTTTALSPHQLSVLTPRPQRTAASDRKGPAIN